MTNNTLLQAQHIVDQLAPLDQVRLLEYLTPRIVHVVESAQASKPMSMTTHAEAWREFFRIGDTLAASDHAESPTMTAAILAMRR